MLSFFGPLAIQNSGNGMEVSELFKDIRQFIHDGLNHRYNKQTSTPLFVLERDAQCTEVTAQRGKIVLIFARPAPFLKIRYRLPQTRIFYTHYQNSDWDVSVLEYFKNTIFLVQSRSGRGTLHLKNSAKCIGTDEKGFRLPEEVSFHSAVWWFHPRNEPGKYHTPLHFLQTIRQHEYRINPVARLETDDAQFLQHIDNLFYQLPYVNASGQLSLRGLRDERFIWVHEFYVQLGYFARLEHFYRQALRKNNLSNTESWFLPHLLRRFRAFSQALTGKLPPKGEAWQAAKPDGYDFLFRYWNSDEHQDTDLPEAIQRYWEANHHPAFRLRWGREIRENPVRAMAFVLLALRHCFWWAPRAAEIVSAYLDVQFQPVFKALVLLTERFAQQVTNGEWRWSAFEDKTARQHLATPHFNVGLHSFGKEEFTELAHAEAGVHFRINRHVQLRVDFLGKTLRFAPHVFRLPVEKPEWSTAQVAIGDWNIEVPLVWEHFYFEWNGIRLKWIRKKRRFQITLKNPFPEIPVKINGERIALREDRFAKAYLAIQRKDSRNTFQMFSLQGDTLLSFSHLTRQFCVRGVALSFFGILKEHCNVYLNESRKNKMVPTNLAKPVPIEPGKLPFVLTCRVRHCDAVTFKPKTQDAIWERFLQTPAELLLEKTKIWVLSPEEEERAAVEVFFQRHFGFCPEMEVLKSKEDFQPQNETFHFFVSKNPALNDEFLEKVGEIKLFRRLKSPKIKYFFVTTEFLTQKTDNPFFIRNNVKN